MRNKILMITAMLAVMVAMTGTASAYNLGLVGGAPIIELGPGQSIDLGARVDATGASSAVPMNFNIALFNGPYLNTLLELLIVWSL